MTKKSHFDIALLKNKLSKYKELVEAQDYFIRGFKDELFDRCIRIMDEDWYMDNEDKISKLKKELGL